MPDRLYVTSSSFATTPGVLMSLVRYCPPQHSHPLTVPSRRAGLLFRPRHSVPFQVPVLIHPQSLAESRDHLPDHPKVKTESIPSAISGCTDLQKIELPAVAGRVCNGILAILGAGGTGKTTVVIRLLLAALMRRQKHRCSTKVGNICIPTQQNANDNDDLHGSRKAKAKRSAKYHFRDSIARRVLQVAGVIPTRNKKLLDIKLRFNTLQSIVAKPRKSLTDDERLMMNQELTRARTEILLAADAIFTTCINGGLRDPCRAYGRLERYEGADRSWGSSAIRTCHPQWNVFGNNRAVNAFGPQLALPSLSMFVDNTWPYWLLSQQLRIEPGLWDLPNDLFYDGQISMHPSNVLSPEGAEFERWAQSYSRGHPGGNITPAKTGEALPIVIDIRNGYTFREPRGISRGNSANVHFCLEAVLDFLKFSDLATAKSIVILTPNLIKRVLDYKMMRETFEEQKESSMPASFRMLATDSFSTFDRRYSTRLRLT
ncbi:hypothetical protein VTL71DRAFT_7748 [Oculimacula yallundae]|uniref:Uncharacterized protein n=1 Tax=Oculimacula yallundae TaxID=86028 RepID=A0ABR4CVK2_9HELO